MLLGILTLFHNNNNWGGVLQGYALKTFLESEFTGVKADLIYYRSTTNVVYPSKVKQALQYSLSDITKKLYYRFSKKSIRDRLDVKKKLFKSFTDSCATNKKIYTDGNLDEAGQLYDCLICGSDQIWNPNVSLPGFYLKGIGSECRKISYAASISRDDLSEYERAVMIPMIEKFDWISVRETTAKKILNQYMPNKQVYEVLDPAMMLDKKQWLELIKDTTTKYQDYALAFFFSESYEYRKTIARYCTEKKLKIIFIPFAANKYIESDERGDCIREYDVGPKEFVSLFLNASAVFTDSFHGVVFSILFHKQFCVYERDNQSKTSKNSRLYDLLTKFGLSDRLIKEPGCAKTVIETPIDFESIETKLSVYRKSSLDFLYNALSGLKSKETPRRVDHLIKSDCCGCGLCSKICPKNCIEMKADTEGFVYPVIGVADCIDCGQCVKNCISRGRKPYHINGHDTYVGFNRLENIRKQSSSGGVFYELAKNMLDGGGVVYGAAYEKDFSVVHARVDSMQDVSKLMTSKYVQSSIAGIYSQIEADLRNGRKVLFTGTPCQVGAIHAYIEKKKLLEGLFLMDFICHGVPSPAVWQSYLHFALKGKHLTKVNFRDKAKGWHDYSFTSVDEVGKRFTQVNYKNIYMHTFLSNKNLRNSCYDCKYKGDLNIADVTVGDAWKIEKVIPEWTDDKGTSLMVVRTNKGQVMLESLPDTFKLLKTEYAIWEKYNSSIVSSALCPFGRKLFFDAFAKKTADEFWKSNKIPIKLKIKNGAKTIIRVMDIGGIIRKKSNR